MRAATEELTRVDQEFVLLGAWPFWVQVSVAIVAIAVLALTAYNYRSLTPLPRRIGLFSLRLLAILGLLALFYQPAILEEEVARARHIVPVLIDLSESHQVAQGELTRHELVSRFVARHGDLWEELGDKDELVFHALSPELEELPDLSLQADHLDTLKPSTKRTDVIGSLKALRGRYPNQSFGAVVILSDGIDTTLAGRSARLSHDAKATIRALDAPLHMFTLPEDEPLKDLSLDEVNANPFAFLMNATTLDVLVRVHGYEGGYVTVRLLDGTHELARERVAIVAGQKDLPLSFEYVPQRLGRSVYTIAVDQAPEEIYLDNNARQIVVNVVRDKIRALQIVGQPSWDERFLRNHLKENPNVDLLSFFILIDHNSVRPAGRDETALIPFPAQELFEDELGSFDLVIFQNFNYGPFQTRQYLPNIAEYVRQGGAFLMVGGPKSFTSGGYYGTAITSILPLELPAGMGAGTLIDEERFRPRLTSMGRHHPITRLAMDPELSSERWGSIEELEGLNITSGAHADANVLLEHPTLKVGPHAKPAPVLVVREVDKGRSMAFTTDTSWNWRFSAGIEGEDSRQYDRFWSQAIRWLIKDPEMDLVKVSVLGEELRVGQAAKVQVQVFQADYSPAQNQAVDLIIRKRAVGDNVGEGEVVTHLQAMKTGADGVLTTELKVESPGIYEVNATTEVVKGRTEQGRALFVSTSQKVELTRVVGDGRLFAQLAEASEGSVSSLRVDDPEVKTRPARIERVLKRRHEDLWASPWALMLLIGLFGLEWALRRRFGYL